MLPSVVEDNQAFGSPLLSMVKQRRRLALLALVALVGALALLVHRPLLQAVGSALLVEDPLARADAIVVVAGGNHGREARAAEIYRHGWAPVVVVSRQAMSSDVQKLIALGVRPLDPQGESRMVLEKLGVPTSAIVAIDEPVKITESELAVVHGVARARGYRRVILVTSPQHTRRVKVIWERENRRDHIEGLVTAAPDDDFSLDGWWRKRRAAESVAHEYAGILAISLGISRFMR